MMPLEDILPASHVNLALSSVLLSDAIDEVLARLNGDANVTDFENLQQAVHQRNAPPISSHGYGICIAHGRTEVVKTLVMAAGRSVQGIVVPGQSDPVNLIFVAGIPAALSSEYLRAVGAIARACGNAELCEKLIGVKSAEKFVHLLAAGEGKM